MFPPVSPGRSCREPRETAKATTLEARRKTGEDDAAPTRAEADQQEKTRRKKRQRPQRRQWQRPQRRYRRMEQQKQK